MNIIKLKDIKMPDSDPKSAFFNKYLKGKYAYWVQMRYIVPFGLEVVDDHLIGMKHEGYVACENDITKLLQREDGTWPKPYGSENIDLWESKEYMRYVDEVETDKINSTVEYRLKNKYSPDENITVDELKQFRTWLAKELLLMDQSEGGEQKYIHFTSTETHVLEYYAKNMYDDTIKILGEFGGQQVSFNELSQSSCGCGSSNLSSLYGSELVVCDPISIYRKNIYNKMVEMFSGSEFWERWSKEFILEIKKYVDNIINMNLPMHNSNLGEVFNDCGCIPTDNHQESFIGILKRLSTSLDYIYNDKTSGHRNYIATALKDWASQLYESMQW